MKASTRLEARGLGGFYPAFCTSPVIRAIPPILAGLENEHVEISQFFQSFSKMPRADSENEQPSGPDRLGGGRERVNPPPCGLV